MHVVVVEVHVIPEKAEEFKQASLINAQNSIHEPGVVRFDVLQQKTDPARFILYEVYRTPADADLHKLTQHYLKWKESVAEMMAEPRKGTAHINLFPEDNAWV
jgi:quinol monooxygenase YgiN